jgi:hypothetical protein
MLVSGQTTMPTPNSEDFLNQFLQSFQEVFAGCRSEGSGLADGIMDHGARAGRMYGEWLGIWADWSREAMKTDPDEEALFKIRERLSKQAAAAYQQFLGNYLTMPGIGLGGEAFEKVMGAMDAYNRLWAALAEFLHEFHLPLAASLKIIRESQQSGEGREAAAQGLYERLIQIADEKYKQYLASPEGVQRVADLVHLYMDFKQRLDGAIEPLLRFHNIPTPREMDDIYRRLHTLRKKNRGLETAVSRQEAAIEKLTKEVAALKKKPVVKKAAKGSGSRRKTGQQKKTARSK